MFYDLNGAKVNLAHVKYVEPEEKRIKVVYAYGGHDYFHARDTDGMAEQLQAFTAPVIPALPGFTLLRLSFYGESDGLKGEPDVELVLKEAVRGAVIAWRIGEFGLEPVANFTVGGDEKAVLEPSGIVTDGEIQWPDINEWANDVCRRWKLRLEYERKERAKAALCTSAAG
jgi:hypothetical protein